MAESSFNSDDPSTNKIDERFPWRRAGAIPALGILLFGPTIRQDRVGALPWIRRVLFGWTHREPSDANAEPLKKGDGQTDPLLLRLVRLGGIMLIVIALYGLSLGGVTDKFHWAVATQFIVWGIIGAMAAGLFGLALGMLFGLPTTRGWTPRRAAPVQGGTNAGPVGSNSDLTKTSEAKDAGQGVMGLTLVSDVSRNTSGFIGSGSLADQDIPYDENTSLEQIADWLTKIIVGLTLVQFSTWRTYFESTAQLLTSLMYRDGAPSMHSVVTPAQLTALAKSLNGVDPGQLNAQNAVVLSEIANPLAGGLVMASFGLLGFLMAYLWMRRYFIPEMVIARRNAVELANIERQNAVELAMSRTQIKLQEVQRELDDQLRKSDDERLRISLLEEARSNSTVIQRRKQSVVNSSDVDSIVIEAVTGHIVDAEMARTRIDEITRSGETITNDLWAGRFGRNSRLNSFDLTGEIKAIDKNPDWFLVELKVTARDAALRRTAGKASAVYFLHPTCKPVTQRVAFGSDGIAPLGVVAFGAFTVGVLIDDGTLLELNLASLPSAQQFQIFLAT